MINVIMMIFDVNNHIIRTGRQIDHLAHPSLAQDSLRQVLYLDSIVLVSALERVEMDNSGEKPCAAIAFDSRLSEKAGYNDDSPAKPISRKKKNSRKLRNGESTSNRYKIMINHDIVGMC